MRSSRVAPALLAAFGGVIVAGCGQARQDANEPHGNFTVDVLRASFPTQQRVASHHHLVLVIKNTGAKTVPDLAVSVANFSATDEQPDLANNRRPVWIVDRGPGPAPTHLLEGNVPAYSQGGYVTAYTNTWASGPLPPGQTVTFDWKVTPIAPGAHSLRYTVAAGLNGNARARLASGQVPRGSFPVDIVGAPLAQHIDPSTGAVVTGPTPLRRG